MIGYFFQIAPKTLQHLLGRGLPELNHTIGSMWLDKVCPGTVVIQFSLLQSLSHVWLFATPWTAAHQAPLSFVISWSLLKFMSTESVTLPHHLILCCFLPLLSSVFPSIRVFSSELALLVRCCIGASTTNECWCPSNGYSGLISFQIDWCDLFAVQGTLKSLLQH